MTIEYTAEYTDNLQINHQKSSKKKSITKKEVNIFNLLYEAKHAYDTILDNRQDLWSLSSYTGDKTNIPKAKKYNVKNKKKQNRSEKYCQKQRQIHPQIYSH